MNQTKATPSETRRERKEEEMTIVRVLSNNIENTIMIYVFMTVYRNMRVVRIIGEETFFRKGCAKIDKRYLYIRE